MPGYGEGKDYSGVGGAKNIRRTLRTEVNLLVLLEELSNIKYRDKYNPIRLGVHDLPCIFLARQVRGYQRETRSSIFDSRKYRSELGGTHPCKRDHIIGNFSIK